jgi:hypothetical protein
MAAFGGRVSPRKLATCPQLAAHGIKLYVEVRKNGRLFLQIRQDKPMKWRLKSIAIGRLGQADIIYEPNPD